MPDVAVKARAERATVDDVLADEAPKGYDFLIIGLDPAQMPEGGFNPEIAKFVRSFEGPLAVVVARGVHKGDPVSAPLKMAPVTGAANTRHSAESRSNSRAPRAPSSQSSSCHPGRRTLPLRAGTRRLR